MRVAEWNDGKEPILQVEKRGRFITNIGFANFVTAAVDSGDPRIKGSCMVILEEDDPGLFDRGTPTKKLVHQLSSTGDPVFNLRVPASRIVGGYTIKDGVIVPNYSHSEVIEAVFRRTRVTVGLMTSAKLLSAIEPVIRYQRGRFRGAETATPGSRSATNWASSSAKTHCTAWWTFGQPAKPAHRSALPRRDCSTNSIRWKSRRTASSQRSGITGGRAEMKAMREVEQEALEYLSCKCRRTIRSAPNSKTTCWSATLLLDAQANVLCPATKLWNTGHGANMMREAVSLMGGYGITEDCPGFLGNKWMDCATRSHLRRSRSRAAPATLRHHDQRSIPGAVPRLDRAKCARSPPTVRAPAPARWPSAMQMWLWTLEHLQEAKDADGNKLYHSAAQGVTFPLADALCWLLASRCQILDVLELEARGPRNPAVAEGLAGTLQFFTDLCHVQSFARRRRSRPHLRRTRLTATTAIPRGTQRATRRCFLTDELDAVEALIPGMSGFAMDVVTGSDGWHPSKAGPCAGCAGSANSSACKAN